MINKIIIMQYECIVIIKTLTVEGKNNGDPSILQSKLNMLISFWWVIIQESILKSPSTISNSDGVIDNVTEGRTRGEIMEIMNYITNYWYNE